MLNFFLLNLLIILFAETVVYGDAVDETRGNYGQSPQTKPQPLLQEIVGTSSWVCESGSYFSSITRNIQTCRTLGSYRCNNTFIAIGDGITLVGCPNNDDSRGQWNNNENVNITLNIPNDCFSRQFLTNGNTVVNRLGAVVGGPCDGALVYLTYSQYVTQGSCNSKYGVTQVDSGPNGSTVIIRNVCASTCYGSVSEQFFPGITF